METAGLRLPRDPTSPRAARDFVRQILVEWQCPPSLAEEAVLLTSEVVANAVIHAAATRTDRHDIHLRVRRTPAGVRVQTTDGSDVMPERRRPTVESGRGLQIVEAVAARWGVVPNGTGKIVWFELEP